MRHPVWIRAKILKHRTLAYKTHYRETSWKLICVFFACSFGRRLFKRTDLGASNFVIGLLAAIGPLSQLLQLPSVFLIEKIRKRRLITVVTAGLSRFCWLIIAISPFVFPPEIAIIVLLILLFAVSSFGAVSGCSWNSWIRDLVPENTMGSFFSKRMRISVGIGIVLSVLAAFFLDLWRERFAEHEIAGYSILFLIGFAAGVLGLRFLAKTPEPKMPDIR